MLVSEEHDSASRRNKALDFLMAHMHSDVLQPVDGHIDNLHDSLNALEEKYSRDDAAARVVLFGKPLNVKLKNFKNAEAYCDKISKLSKEFIAKGSTVKPEKDFV